MKEIDLSVGAGGLSFQHFYHKVILKYLSNEHLIQANDAAIVTMDSTEVVMATDSYVINPLFFPGGDIGKLAFCGTVNDLAMMGARPKYLSLAFILEEGFEVEKLKVIVKSISTLSKALGIPVVTGDTKVVEKGKADGLFINTSGIGSPIKRLPQQINVGDKIIISGTLGDHAIAIMAARENLAFQVPLLSDCAPLNLITEPLLKKYDGIKFMRDVTRGGLASVLNEIVSGQNFGIRIDETCLPIKSQVKSACELFGLDVLGLANEGKFIIIASNDVANQLLSEMHEHLHSKDACIIGEVVTSYPAKVGLITKLGPERIIAWPVSDPLPRIC